VPGFVAAMHRHLRSLRRMRRDHGWIDPLLEESINERMHLLIFMQHCKPTLVERAFVIFAQMTYVSFYSAAYFVSPSTAHRAVGEFLARRARRERAQLTPRPPPPVKRAGYLEEAAQRAYNELLHGIDVGEIPNAELPPNSIAAKFYRLPPGSRFRDIVLHVRADEIYHNLYNHALASQARKEGGLDEAPVSVEEDIARYDAAVGGPLARAARAAAASQPGGRRPAPDAASTFDHGHPANKI